MKTTLLLLTACLALTAATAQRPDDRFDADLSDRELRSLAVPDPFDNRANDAYAARDSRAYGSSQYNRGQPDRFNNRDRKGYRRAFEDGYRVGYRDGFRDLPGRRLRRPGNPAEIGFSDGYQRGVRAGQSEHYSRSGNRYDDRYGRRDGYPNTYPRRY